MAADGPDLASYQILLANSSAGKDSAAMLYELVRLADAAGVRDRVHVVHADLGDVEWERVPELAARHSARYDLPFTVVRREQDTLLEYVQRRGRWPSSAARYCTSDLKRAPVRKLMTALVAVIRQRPGTADPVRVLNVMGPRAQESAGRAKRPFRHDAAASNGRRHVDEWLPVHTWSLDDIRRCHEHEQLELHPAYRRGMTRLSCSLCVLAARGDLVRAARLRPDLAARYRQVEQEVDHTFRADLSIAAVIELAEQPAAQPAPTLFCTDESPANWRCPTWPPPDSLTDTKESTR